jgi:hypothetical protein
MDYRQTLALPRSEFRLQAVRQSYWPGCVNAELQTGSASRTGW